MRTEKLTLLRRLSNVKPPEPLNEVLPTSGESETDEPLDLELLRLEADRRTPRKCRAASGMCGTTDTSLHLPPGRRAESLKIIRELFHMKAKQEEDEVTENGDEPSERICPRCEKGVMVSLQESPPPCTRS